LPIILLGGSSVSFSTRFARGHRIGIAASLPLCALLSFGCASTKPTMSTETPSAEELYRKGLSLMEEPAKTLWVFPNSDHAKAIESFQQIIDNYPYSDYAILAELKIADAYYDDGKYDEALSYYRDFGDLHPQHEQVPYTLFRAAMCHYKQSKDASRDQTATRLSLGFLDQLLARYPHSPQAPEAEQLWKELRTRLADHEMRIAGFYLQREEYQSAADRYRSVLNKYPGLGLDAQALYQLGVCYSKMNLEDEAQKIFEVILRNYQGSDVAKQAADLIPAAN